MPPPPPKPGVIPAGPLGLGDILGGAFATMGRYWKQLFGIAAAVYGAAAVVVGVGPGDLPTPLVGDHLRRDHTRSTRGRLRPGRTSVPLLFAFLAVWGVAMITLLLATAMVYAAVPAILQDAVLGRPTTFGIVWRRAAARRTGRDRHGVPHRTGLP